MREVGRGNGAPRRERYAIIPANAGMTYTGTASGPDVDPVAVPPARPSHLVPLPYISATPTPASGSWVAAPVRVRAEA